MPTDSQSPAGAGRRESSLTSEDLFRRWSFPTVLWVALAWLSCEFFLLGPYSYFRMHDSGNNNVALLVSLAADPLNGGYWYPAVIGGFDRLASGFFTGMDRIFYAILPAWLPSQVFSVAMIVAGGWFAFRVGTERLRLPPAAALVGALAHATLMGNLQMGVASVAFLPFLIWAVGRALDRGSGSARWVLACGSALAVGLSTQAHILLPFTPALLVLWFAILEPRRRMVDWLLVAAACAAIFVTQATVIAALAANAPLSYRGAAALAGNSEFGLRAALFDPIRWSRLLDTALFALAVLGFTIGACQRRIRSPRLPLFLIIVWLLPVLAEAAKALVVPWLPLLSGFRLERFALYDSFFLGLAAAAGLTFLTDEAGPVWRRRSLSWRAVAIGIALILIFGQSLRFKIHHAYEWIQQGNYVQNFESSVLRELAKSRQYQAEPFRVVSVNMPTNVLAAYGLETIDGYVNIYSRRFREFWERVVAGKIAREGPLTAMSEVRLFHNAEMSVVDFAAYFNLDLLSLVNVRYIVARNELQHPNLRLLRGPPSPWAALPLSKRVAVRFQENFAGSDWIYIYENLSVQPRAFFADTESFSDPAALLSALTSRTAAQLRERALVLVGDMPHTVKSSQATIQALRRGPDLIEVDVAVEDDAVLAVTDNFSPFWRCRVDGQPCVPFPVYHTFIGVRVPRGARRLTLTYEPPQRLF
jgi:hypothetical protein